MVDSRQRGSGPLVPVAYVPPGDRTLPVEVLDRASVLARKPTHQLGRRQRVGFNVWMVCTAGAGSHVVDFAPIELSARTCVRVRPGQVQRFDVERDFDAVMVVWPDVSGPVDPSRPTWYPGCGAATSWELAPDLFAKVLALIDELRDEQERFDGSPTRIALMQALLRVLTLRIDADVPGSVPRRQPAPAALPRASQASRGAAPRASDGARARSRSRLQHPHARPGLQGSHGADRQARARRTPRAGAASPAHAHRPPDLAHRGRLLVRRSLELLEVRPPPPRGAPRRGPRRSLTTACHRSRHRDEM